MEFEFVEIEQAAKIARENHNIQMFTQNAISFDELRERNGMEPVEDLSRFWFQLIQQQASSGTVENNDRPANQHGKQDSPPNDSLKDSVKNRNNVKKMQENDNSLLTNKTQMVNLTVDDVNNSLFSEKLTQSWKRAEEQLHSHTDISQVLNRSFDSSLFPSVQEKQVFIDRLTAVVEWKQTHSSDWSFFDLSVQALYTQSLSSKEVKND